MTSKYETVLVLNTKPDEEAVKALLAKFTDLISNNGEIVSVDEWGKRRLAYEINDEVEGYYTVITFTCDPTFVAELDRVYKITDGVLRSIIVRIDEE